MHAEMGDHQAAPGSYVEVDLDYMIGRGPAAEREGADAALARKSKGLEVAFQRRLQRVLCQDAGCGQGFGPGGELVRHLGLGH